MATRQINKWGEGARLRGELMEATTRLLARATSRDSVTLRAIARETGIAAPSIYKHFEDRDAVIDAVVAETFRELDAVCERAYHAHAGGSARVRAISWAYVEFALERTDEYRVLFERSTANLSEVAGAYPAGLHAFQYLAEALREAAAERAAAVDSKTGGMRGDGGDRDSFRDAEVLWAALHGMVTLRSATPGFPWTSTAVMVEAVLDRFAPAAPSPPGGGSR